MKRRPRASPLKASEKLVLEALHDLGGCVRVASLLPGSLLSMQYLRRALAAGEPTHSARALAQEGLWGVLNAPNTDGAALFDESRALADSTGEPALIAEVEYLRGLSRVARCEFEKGVEHLSFAHELLQSRCPGEPYLLTTTRTYLGSAWLYLGEFRTIAQNGGAWLSEALAKKDRFASSSLASFGAASLRHLLDDDPDQALSELDALMAPWPKEPFSSRHFGSFMVRAYAFAYQGNPEFLPWIERNEASWQRAYLMRTPSCQAAFQAFKVEACLFAAVHAAGKQDGPTLASARTATHALSKVRGGVAPGLTELCQAWLDAYERKSESALAHAQKAQRLLAGSTYQHWAHYLEGAVEGGEAGRAKCASVRERFVAQGFRNPERVLGMIGGTIVRR